MTLGKRIKTARVRAGLTQKKVGDTLKVTDAAVSSWERGDTIPEFDKLNELIKVLKVSAKWLISGRSDTIGDDDLSRLWEGLSEAQQRQAIRFLKMLAEDDSEAA